MKKEPIRIQLPASKEQFRSLRAGDEVLLTGTLVTSRDMGHKLMVERHPEFLKPLLKGTVIYHCGPIVMEKEDGWKIISAGPTTSSREEPFQADVIAHYGIGGVIGKGGMGEKTSKAMVEHGAVYFHATGGAGALLAKRIIKVKDVHMLEEFGVPEAFWVLEVEDFPAVVTMDSIGGSLHRQILADSAARRQELLDL
jgi:fumarate hydratase subunit beta